MLQITLLKIDTLKKKNVDTSQIWVYVQASTVYNGKAAINEKQMGFEANSRKQNFSKFTLFKQN